MALFRPLGKILNTKCCINLSMYVPKSKSATYTIIFYYMLI